MQPLIVRCGLPIKNKLMPKSSKICSIKILMLICLISISIKAFSQKAETYLFVGTYTGGMPDKGIYIYTFNTETGSLKLVSTGENIINPSFLAISPNGENIYACTATKLQYQGSISAFKFNAEAGTLAFINKQSSGGDNPVYVTTDSNNKHIICGNYSGGSVAVFTTNTDGSLNPITQLITFMGNGINERRQEKAHIHATVFSPDFKYLFIPDLGSDKIYIFNFNTNDSLTLKPATQQEYIAIPGSGPRHFTFHPNKHFAYSIDELSGTVTAFKYYEGSIERIQTIFAYSKLQTEYNSADIHISPDGLFLYASNRFENENTIAIFSIDTVFGTLKLIAHQPTLGENPRNFTIDPSGNYLIVANQVSNNIVVFKRDPLTGLLTKTGIEVQVPAPACLIMKEYGN